MHWTLRKLFFLLSVLFISIPCLAQNSRRDDVAQRSVSGFSSFISGATITVFKSDGVTLAPICSSETDTTCSQPNPFNSDAFGNYGFWLPPGIGEFVVNISAANFTPKIVTYTIPCDPKACVGNTFLGSLKVTALGTPSAPTVTVIGTQGVTSYTYFCDSRDANNNQTLPSSGTTITNGNSSLTISNFNSVTCAENGAYKYDVLKTNTSTLLGTVTPSFPGGPATLNDIGQVTSAYTPPAQDNTGGSATLFSQLGGSIVATQFGNQINLLETNSAVTGVGGTDIIWANGNTHRLNMNNNNGGGVQIVGSGGDINSSDQVTVLHFGTNAVPLGTTAPTNGQVPFWNGSALSWTTSGASNVQIFTSSGTWNKPTTSNTTIVVMLGGGGGGGGGYNSAMAGGNGSGGGGGGGSYSIVTVPTSILGNTETVTVGTGGTGGTPGTPGLVGGNGNSSSFGNWVKAAGGNGGNPGANASNGTGGTAASTGAVYFGGNGGAGGNNFGLNGTVLGAGGGGGGGAGTLNTAGGVGGNGSPIHNLPLLGGSAGTGTGSGNPGTSGATNEPVGGGGGGGGGGHNSGTAGSGGNGGNYGGGGGGGGGNSGGTAGTGGNGANGIVIVVSY